MLGGLRRVDKNFTHLSDSFGFWVDRKLVIVTPGVFTPLLWIYSALT